ncbi:4'-phosphopantetheinyl transferase family protein, partial [Thermodesulfobacteriota bacterium]
QLKVRERVLNLSRLARRALEISAKRSDVKLCELLKDENGAPMPINGVFWSISHKPEYVGGVVALEKIGVDIEKIRPCASGLFQKTATESEWTLFGSEDPFNRFFRCWTAKEAVIKAEGTGIKDLLRCVISEVIDEHHLIIDFQNRKWFIEHFFFNGHIASVVKTSETVEWILIENSEQ